MAIYATIDLGDTFVQVFEHENDLIEHEGDFYGYTVTLCERLDDVAAVLGMQYAPSAESALGIALQYVKDEYACLQGEEIVLK